ncbi:MAG: SCP2 sterol-binding domain-containing protein [Candidatus Helarchaeota archaeon]
MYKYLSKEWLEQGKNLVNANAEFRKIAGKFSASFVHIVLNPPDGQNLDYVSVFKDGRCIDVHHGTMENPTFRITADYKDWVSLHQGKANIINLVLTGRFSFEGNLDDTIDYNHLIIAMMSIFPEIPTEF